jgi:hypothetical protein
VGRNWNPEVVVVTEQEDRKFQTKNMSKPEREEKKTKEKMAIN